MYLINARAIYLEWVVEEAAAAAQDDDDPALPAASPPPPTSVVVVWLAGGTIYYFTSLCALNFNTETLILILLNAPSFLQLAAPPPLSSSVFIILPHRDSNYFISFRDARDVTVLRSVARPRVIVNFREITFFFFCSRVILI